MSASTCGVLASLVAASLITLRPGEQPRSRIGDASASFASFKTKLWPPVMEVVATDPVIPPLSMSWLEDLIPSVSDALISALLDGRLNIFLSPSKVTLLLAL